MNPRRLVLPFILLVALTLYFFIFEGIDTPPEPAKEKLMPLVRDEISALRLKRDTFEIFIERERDGYLWRITSPINYRADKASVDNLLIDAGSCENLEVISESAQDLAQFGLDPPKYILTVIEKDSSREITLLYGFRNPSGDRVYLLKPGTRTVIASQSRVVEALEYNLDNFRDKKITESSSDDVTRFSIRFNEKLGLETLSFVKKGDTWRHATRENILIDPIKARNLIYKLTRARVRDFVDAPEKDTRAVNLSNPDVIFTLGFDGTREDEIFELASSAIEEDFYYVRNRSLNQTFRVRGKALEDIGVTLSDVRDRKILSLEPQKVKRLTIVDDSGAVLVFEKIMNSWSLEKEGKKRSIGRDTIETMLVALKGLSADGFVDDTDEGWIKSVFSRLKLKITVEMVAPETSETLLVARTLENFSYFVKKELAGEVFTISAGKINDIYLDFLDLARETGEIFLSRDKSGQERSNSSEKTKQESSGATKRTGPVELIR